LRVRVGRTAVAWLLLAAIALPFPCLAASAGRAHKAPGQGAAKPVAKKPAAERRPQSRGRHLATKKVRPVSAKPRNTKQPAVKSARTETTRPLKASPRWLYLARLVDRWRLNDLDGLDRELLALEEAPGSRSIAAAAAFVRARVLARQHQGKAAAQALERAKAMREVHEGAWSHAEIEVLVAQGRKVDAVARIEALGTADFRRDARDLLHVRLVAETGPPQKARNLALQLYGASAVRQPRDELLAIAAQATFASGDADGSKALWKQLLVQHPESDFVDEADRHVALASLTQAEQFDRVERLFARRSYERCREGALALWRQGYRQPETGYWLGKIASERLRDDHEGAPTYLAAAIGDDSPVQSPAMVSYGLALAKLGRFDEALAVFDGWLAKFPDAPNERRIEVHYDRGRTLHVAGRSLQAAHDLLAALAQDRRGIDYPKYHWFAAWWTLRGGDCKGAIALMEPLTKHRNPLVGGKARYWTAKCLEQLGDRKVAVAMLARLARTMPHSYYAGLGENLLEDWGAADQVPKRLYFWQVGVETRDAFQGLPASPSLERLRLACSIGEPDTCRDVMDDERRTLGNDLGAARVAHMEGELADALEDFAEAREQALDRHEDVLEAPPARKTLAAWRAIYPRAFATHVRAAAERSGAPEWMIYAHMLQESRYKPWLISGAPAYGLLELLDRTARRLAREAGDDYQLWMLMQPAWNVRWGAQYLGALYRKFHGQLPFAIASYNGGPMLVEWHLRQSHTRQLEFDALVEDLGPHESRNYVRMVIGHMLRYLAIYEAPERAQVLRGQLLPRTWRKDSLRYPNY
jgi:soluble lytic murein transglycosylase